MPKIPCTRRFHGFTFVELVLVVAISGILASLAIPLVGGMMNRMRVGSATQELFSVLSLAQSRATANPRVHCGVFLDTTGDAKALIFEDTNRNGQYDPGTDDIYENTVELGDGVSFSLSGVINAKILFRGNGTARNGGTIDLEKGNARRGISIDAATGRVTIQ